MAQNVKIELTPYNALAILAFCREYINDDTRGNYKFKAIQDAVDQYEQQIYKNVSCDQLDDAKAENAINKLIGKCPSQ